MLGYWNAGWLPEGGRELLDGKGFILCIFMSSLWFVMENGKDTLTGECVCVFVCVSLCAFAYAPV